METAVYLAAAVAGGSCVAATTATLYRCVRPRFPVRVNCWFCDKNTDVPYGNRNCWDCPHCEQYNGFAQDGDYNKPIPAQYVEDFNYPITPERKSDNFNSTSDVLCPRCQSNQLLKVKQLANFVPHNEATFDVEVDLYKQHLDELYRLCRWCDQSVYEVLDKQDRSLRKKLKKHVDSQSEGSNKSSFMEESELIVTKEREEKTPHRIVLSSTLLYGILTALIAILLLIITTDKLLVQSSVELTSQWAVLNKVVRGVRVLSRVRLPLAGCGLLCSVFLVVNNRTSRLRMPSLLVFTSLLTSVIVLSRPTWLPHHDNLVLQICVSMVTLAISVSFLKRLFMRKAKHIIRMTKCKPSRNVSYSEACPERSQDNSPASSVADDDDQLSVKSQEEEDCFSDFETMSIGSPESPKKYRKKKRDIFSSYEPRHNSQAATPSSTTSPFLRAQSAHRPLQSSPILRPATFRHKPTSGAKFNLSDIHLPSSNRGFHNMPSTSLGFSNNNNVFNNSFTSGSGSLFAPGLSTGLFQAKNPWAGSCPGSAAPSVASEDGGSLFNELRVSQSAPDPEDEAPTHQSGSSSGSSLCPVDTTTDNLDPANPSGVASTSETNARRLSWKSWQRPILKLSILFNMCLLLYLCLDMETLRAGLLKTLVICEHVVFGLKSHLNNSTEQARNIL